MLLQECSVLKGMKVVEIVDQYKQILFCPLNLLFCIRNSFILHVHCKYMNLNEYANSFILKTVEVNELGVKYVDKSKLLDILNGNCPPPQKK